MIYICIPAHNEEQTVGVVLWKIRQVMTEFQRDYQILVADDASTDATPSVLEPYARVLPLTIIRNPERRGYAASLEMLLREAVTRAPYAKRDTIVTLQGDFTDDPQDLVALVKLIEAGADLVTGNRVLPGDVPRKLRWAHRALEWSARRMRVPAAAGDPLSSYRAYRVYTVRKALEHTGPRRLLTTDGPAANAQLLAACAPHARRAESIDVALRMERLQRDSRFVGWETFRQIFQLVRGGAPPAADAQTIAPAEQAQHSRDGIYFDGDELAEAGARHRGNGRAARAGRGVEARETAGRGGRREGNGGRERGSRDGGEARAGRATAQGQAGGRAGSDGRARTQRSDATRATPRREAASRTDAQRDAGEPRPPRGRGARGGAAGGAPAADAQPEATIPDTLNPATGSPDTTTGGRAPTAEGAAPVDPSTTDGGQATDGEAAESGAPKRRRSRRGGRGRKRPAAAAGEDPQQDATAEPGAGGAADVDTAPGDDSAQSGDENVDGAPKRRRSRRGSRGGRRRRGATAAADGSADGNDAAGKPDAPADHQAPSPVEGSSPAPTRTPDASEAPRGDAS